MTGRTYILLVLLFTAGISASAQVTNRHKVIEMILEEHKIKPLHSSTYQPEVLTPHSSSILCTSVNPVPKYSLPKGNVFCRLEDYVQMHTPMKLNIGVGGQ
ncbi:MAG: hypothetical protein JWO03_2694 [Bacteroidetes bacterium]|nr:hypothetical protein [Bacteroidota bacterium]